VRAAGASSASWAAPPPCTALPNAPSPASPHRPHPARPQGSALAQLQQFFSLLATSGAPQASYDALFAALLAAGLEQHAASKQCQQSTALCLGVLTAAVGGAKPAEAARKLLAGAGSSAAAQRLALLALGEVGRRADLSGVPEVEASVLAALSAENEDVKAAGESLGARGLGASWCSARVLRGAAAVRAVLAAGRT
jgi:hypothetical protein